MKKHDIRWIQRAQNYEKAFQRLKEAIEQDELNELERNGLIQRFERILQNRAFVKFQRYREIEILTYRKYAPVPMSLWP